MKILFLLSPSVSIFEKKSCLEIAIGGSNAAGVLDSHFGGIDMYDMNYILNEFRDEDVLSEDEFSALSNPPHIIDIVKGKRDLPPKIKFWVMSLCEDLDIQNLDSYDAVCVSLNRWMYKYYPSIAAYALSIYVLQALHVKVPIYIGGEYAYEMMEANQCLDLFIEEIDFVSYVRGRDIATFISSLNNIVPRRKIELGQVKKPQIDFKVDCNHEYTNEIEDVFPSETLEKYPKLYKAESLFLSPFKFSEGCIFKCAFCPSGIENFFEKSEVMETVDKLESLYDAGYTDFRFFNDNINFKLRYTIEMANEIVRRNLKIRFSDSANMRVGSEEMFRALGEAGCIKLWYGTETVTPRILKQVHKEVSTTQINNVLEWSDKAGIWNSCNFIFNFPHETEEDFQSLVDFIKMNTSNGLINTYATNIFKLLLGTEYEKFPERFDIVLSELDAINKMYKFDEIGGISWDERVQKGNERYQYLEQTLWTKDRLMVTQNDHLLFGARKAGFNKKETIEIIDHVDRVASRDYINKINPAIADDYLKYYEPTFVKFKS